MIGLVARDAHPGRAPRASADGKQHATVESTPTTPEQLCCEGHRALRQLAAAKCTGTIVVLIRKKGHRQGAAHPAIMYRTALSLLCMY